MAYMKSSEVAEIRRLARLLYFSDETIDAFCEKASAGQLRALGDVIDPSPLDCEDLQISDSSVSPEILYRF